jgi:hypothetical protein
MPVPSWAAQDPVELARVRLNMLRCRMILSRNRFPILKIMV